MTDPGYDIHVLAQRYRDRADARNAFEKLKNQWDWGGYTTKDMKRCQLTAMTVTLAYNWWSPFVRLAHPGARLEAMTSRPLLLFRIGRLTSHAGEVQLSIMPMHAKAKHVHALLGGERETQGMEKRCGAVAFGFGLAARVRVRGDSRGRMNGFTRRPSPRWMYCTRRQSPFSVHRARCAPPPRRDGPRIDRPPACKNPPAPMARGISLPGASRLWFAECRHASWRLARGGARPMRAQPRVNSACNGTR